MAANQLNRMDQLIALLCDEADGVLIQAPYYSGQSSQLVWTRKCRLKSQVLGFDKDLGARNGYILLGDASLSLTSC